jgi:ATP-dependent Clp protease ATP-binding subunit ClpB
MTSNIGSHIIQENLEKITSENRERILIQTKEEVFELLKKSIRPEFINRVDEIIMFQPLTQDEIRKIVELQLKKVEQMLEKNKIKLSASKKAIDHIADVGFDPQFGARPIKRVIQKDILNELSKMLLSEKISKDTTILVDEKNGQLTFKNK